MRELFITDIKRILKDKLFIAICVVAAVFAILTPALDYSVVKSLELNYNEMLTLSYDAKTLFFAAFSPTGDFGFILPILLAIIISKDYKYGTIRNKVICGKTRSEIYTSIFLSGATVMCGMMLIYGLLTLCISLFFFPYQAGIFDFSDFGYLILSLIFEMLLYLLITAIVCLFSIVMKNVGLAIVMYFSTILLVSLLGGIFTITAEIAKMNNADVYGVLDFLSKINIFTSGLVGGGAYYSFTDILYIVVPTLLFAGGVYLLGRLVFTRKDIK